MKKLLAAIISLAMCTAAFTACGKDSEADTAVVDQVTVTSESEATTSETTAVTAKVIENSYDNLDDFIDEAFELKTETVPESPFIKYAEENLDENGLYFDMETPDGSMNMLLAANSDADMCIKAEGAGESVYIYVIDGIMYMLDTKEKTGFSMDLDKDTVDSIKNEALSGMNIEEQLDSENESSECVEVEIEGRIYTFENLEEIGVLFDKGGDIYAIINGDTDKDVRAFIVNEMSSNVPEGIIALPTDYEIIDMKGLLAGLEDESDVGNNSSGTPAGTEFATVDEFLEIDFTTLEGEECDAEDSLSAEIFSIFTSDKMYVSSTHEGKPMTVVIDEGKVMLESDFGDTGEPIKFIIIGDVLYAVSDADKMVIVSSDGSLGTADEIIAASKESFSDVRPAKGYTITRSVVTIGGKNYIVETDGDRNTCVMFYENEELYAIVDDGEFSEWTITDEIPDGIFDIPSDYEVVDMNEME